MIIIKIFLKTESLYSFNTGYHNKRQIVTRDIQIETSNVLSWMRGLNKNILVKDEELLEREQNILISDQR